MPALTAGAVALPLWPAAEATYIKEASVQLEALRQAADSGQQMLGGVEADATVHRWRHTFAINYLRNGGNVLELARMMGHSRTETLQIYVDLAQTDLQDAQRRASPADNWRL